MPTGLDNCHHSLGIWKDLVSAVLTSLLLTSRSGRARVPLLLLVGLLIGIRLIAETIASTCLFDLDTPTDRTFHIHGAGHPDHCQHSRYNIPPLVAWACNASKDFDGYSLPEIPRLPILTSFFVAVFLLIVSFGSRPLIVAHGRGPPPLLIC
jgi:hypothetical protein